MRLKFIACKFTVFIQNVQTVKKIISFIKKQLSQRLLPKTKQGASNSMSANERS